ncbi:class I SAM-dependent methyltransferase [Williamsia deligens]
MFRDPLAWAILGIDRAAVLASVGDDPNRALRLFIAARHRFAEDRARAAIADGCSQVIVLGAGLDTFAHRVSGTGVTAFEVDHPATAAWKRDRLHDAGIVEGPHVRHVTVDFERDDLLDALHAGGVDATERVVVMWLGVVPYLSRDAVAATLNALGTMHCEVVADYRAPLSADADDTARQRASLLEERTASVGEPLSEPLDPLQMRELLDAAGFVTVDDLDRSAIRSRLLGLPPVGGAGGAHIVAAST